MGHNVDYEREVDLRELIFAIIKKWRQVLLTAIIFAVICSGYKSLSSMKAYYNQDERDKQEKAYQTALEIYNTTKEKIEKDIDKITLNIEKQKDYNDNSILMSINPYGIQTALLTYYIDTDYMVIPNSVYQNIDTTNMVINAYNLAAKSGQMYNYIIDHLSYDIESKYLQEVISITSDYDNDMITIKILHSDKEACKEISELICNFFNELKDELQKAIGDHKLTLINKSYQSEVDINYTTLQNRNTQTLTDYANSLKEKQTSLTALQIPVKNNISMKSIIKSIIKFAILGFAVGAFLAMGILLLAFMLSDKLTRAKEIRLRYNLPVLGSFDIADKQAFLGFIDRFIYRLEDKTIISINRNEAAKITHVNIIKILNQDEERRKIKKIIFTGTIKEDDIKQVFDEVGKLFSDSDYQLSYCCNICISADAISKISDSDAVILVEKIGCSTYTHISNEIDNIKDLNKEIVGAIII